MDPRWQSTDDERVVPVRSAAATPAGRRVSRAPAAIVGIALILGAAAYAFGGDLLGQLTNPTPDVTIRLTPTGPDPEPAEVRPGQVIRFVNEDQIPHVLSSQTLPTPDGKPFVTANMFAGGDAFFTLPVDAPEGAYPYISETNPQFSGTIVVGTAAVTASSASSEAASAQAVSSVPPTPASSVAPLPLPASSRSASAAPLPAGVIAVNPHVVGGKGPGTATSAKPGVTQHKPTSNAESGAETWIIVACAILAVALASRGAFRRA
jgi:plastocyanin